MNNKEELNTLCFKCGKTLTKDNAVLNWSKVNHLAFDSLLKIKSIIEDQPICLECFEAIKNKEKIQSQPNHLKKNTLNKSELLSLKKVISETFERRNAISNFPFRIIFNEASLPTHKPAQALFTVPKRNFKLAVDRNLMRRRIKEAYRNNKHELYHVLEEQNMQIAIIIIYIGRKEIPYLEVEEKLIQAIQKIIAKLQADQ